MDVFRYLHAEEVAVFFALDELLVLIYSDLRSHNHFCSLALISDSKRALVQREYVLGSGAYRIRPACGLWPRTRWCRLSVRLCFHIRRVEIPGFPPQHAGRFGKAQRDGKREQSY